MAHLNINYNKIKLKIDKATHHDRLVEKNNKYDKTIAYLYEYYAHLYFSLRHKYDDRQYTFFVKELERLAGLDLTIYKLITLHEPHKRMLYQLIVIQILAYLIDNT